MKITGGEFRGRIIRTPRTSNVRPSTEKLREAIFSALGSDIVDAAVADLFCGSGALGLEALSRGAKWALFVDSNRNSASMARSNIDTLGVTARSKVLTINTFNIRPSQLKGIKIIFADPPYGKGYCRRLASLLSLQKYQWHGILVLEHESEWSYDGCDYNVVRRLGFGDTGVSFLLRLGDSEAREGFEGA